MENNIALTTGSQDVKIIDRKSIHITGVIKIDSFDNEEFLLETGLGPLIIKGEDLEIMKLDTHDGVVAIKGLIISLSYVDGVKKNKGNVWEKLFK